MYPHPTEKQHFTTRHGVLVVAIAIVAMLLLGSVLAWNFAEREKERASLHWQQQLGMVAESRAAATEQWVEEQFRTLQGLAGNMSLQLYLTEFSQGGGKVEAVTDAVAQTTYLKMLLQVTAEKSGFDVGTVESAVAEHVEAVGTGGLALLDRDGALVASSKGMPALYGPLESFIKQAAPAERKFLDIFVGSNGTPMIAFLVPVFAIQGERSAADQMGIIVGVRPLDASLLGTLEQKGLTYKTGETMLLRQQEQMLEYISPTREAAQLLGLRLDVDTPGLAEAKAFQSPGQFVEGMDYRQTPVLAVARPIVNTPWAVVHKIDEKEAMTESRLRVRQLTTTLLSAFAVMALLLLAVWRHASSLRAEALAEDYRQLSRRSQRQGDLLKLVTDTEPDSMFIMDTEGTVRYLNARFAQQVGLTSQDCLGRPLRALVDSEYSARHATVAERVRHTQHSEMITYQNLQGQQVRVIQANYIYLPAIPDPLSNETVQGVLVIEQDISTAVLERDRRERTLRQLVSTLIAVVDKRDSFAANHSSRVAKLSGLIAEEMHVDTGTRDTAVTAGTLLNVGKIFVPEAILTHAGPLNKEQMVKVRQCILSTAELLDGIEFDGPVAETIRQSQEHWDGSGMLGLRETAILTPARITSVSNAFVSLVSERSYREGKTAQEAVDVLLQQIGVQYDRAVVVALANLIENSSQSLNWLFEGYRPAANDVPPPAGEAKKKRSTSKKSQG